MASAVGMSFAGFFGWVIVICHNPGWSVLPGEAANAKNLEEQNVSTGRCVCSSDRMMENLDDETTK